MIRTIGLVAGHRLPRQPWAARCCNRASSKGDFEKAIRHPQIGDVLQSMHEPRRSFPNTRAAEADPCPDELVRIGGPICL